jgi:hypothetical protein
MARRTDTVTIDTPGRDLGKVFVITEMAAEQAESWAIKALLALTNAGATVPDSATGMAGLASAGLQALGKLPYESVKPLLDEMFTCVKYQHKPGHPLQDIESGPASQIEEVATRLELRKRIFKLHTGF